MTLALYNHGMKFPSLKYIFFSWLMTKYNTNTNENVIAYVLTTECEMQRAEGIMLPWSWGRGEASSH